MGYKRIILLILCLILTGCKGKSYTVTFNTDGGEVMNSISIKEGSTIEKASIPSKEGYVFVEWLKDGLTYETKTPVTEDLNLTAKWVEAPDLQKEYNISFNIDGKIEKEVVKGNTKIKKPDNPVKENYKFLGWYIGETIYNFDELVSKDLVLVAKFEKEKVTINFELNGGTGINTKTIEKGNVLNKPDNPIKFGYKFIKWKQGNNDYDFTKEVKENITLTAIWEAIVYVKITFDTNGGNEIAPQTIESGRAISAVEAPVKDGYTFLNWSLNGETFDISTKVEKNITLKAVYEKN